MFRATGPIGPPFPYLAVGNKGSAIKPIRELTCVKEVPGHSQKLRDANVGEPVVI